VLSYLGDDNSSDYLFVIGIQMMDDIDERTSYLLLKVV
jgi:hypothetical protein